MRGQELVFEALSTLKEILPLGLSVKLEFIIIGELPYYHY